MKKDYRKIAQEIIQSIGGKENIASCFHCMTRLRFEIKDMSKVDNKAVNDVDGVLGTKEAGGMYQVIIGNDVAKVYAEVCSQANISMKDSIDENLEQAQKEPRTLLEKIKKGFNSALTYISSCMISLIPVMMASGLTMAIISIIGPNVLGIIKEGSDTYTFLYMIYNAGYYFMPVFIGYNAAKHLKIDPNLGGFMGSILIAPQFMEMVEKGTAFKILGMNVFMQNYTSTVLPVAMSVALMSVLYKWLKKVIPDLLSTIFTPVITILIIAPISFLFIAPLGGIIGSAIGNGIIAFGQNTGFIGVGIVSGLWPFLVMAGMHQVVGITLIVNMFEVGYSAGIGAAAANCANWACFGIALAAFLRLKSRKSKNISMECFISGIIGGVSEPTLFGMCLKYRRLFAALFLGGLVGGAYMAITGVKVYILATSNFLSIISYSGGSVANFINACIGLALTMLTAGLVTYFFGFSKEELYA